MYAPAAPEVIRERQEHERRTVIEWGEPMEYPE
jgi:hypothetical protein